jgi:hypothetical protein
MYGNIPRMDVEAAFEEIASRLLREPDVEAGTGFGNRPGLTAGSRIFVILRDDELVLKLPGDRCTELVARGYGRPFETGGREMREWIAVDSSHQAEWPTLTDEALAFVGPGSNPQ